MSIFLILNLIMKKTYQDNVFHFDNFLNYFFRCQPKDVSSMCFVKLMNCRQCDRVFIWFFFCEHETIFFFFRSDLLFHTIHRICAQLPLHKYTQNQLFFSSSFSFFWRFFRLSLHARQHQKKFLAVGLQRREERSWR